jgi:hypothetical protein
MRKCRSACSDGLRRRLAYALRTPSATGSAFVPKPTPDEPEAPTEDEMEAVLAALLQVDPSGISGKHDAKKARQDDDEDGA